MKNYKRIRRIFENTEIAAEPSTAAAMPAQMPTSHMEPAQQVPEMPEVEPQQTLALPPAAPTVDPMVMTVRDFLEKIKPIEPLVAMGIEAFIEKNMGSLMEPTTSPVAMTQEPDLTFSSQVPPAAPAATNDLTFSSQVPAEELPIAEMPA